MPKLSPRLFTRCILITNESEIPRGFTGFCSGCHSWKPQFGVQNNFALVCLLLGVDSNRANKMAADIYKKNPNNLTYASTYAFSLFLRGNAKEAAETLDHFSPGDLQKAAVASYYGVFLAAAGRKQQARYYLERGMSAQLLPEEKALLEKASLAARR